MIDDISNIITDCKYNICNSVLWSILISLKRRLPMIFHQKSILWINHPFYCHLNSLDLTAKNVLPINFELSSCTEHYIVRRWRVSLIWLGWNTGESVTVTNLYSTLVLVTIKMSYLISVVNSMVIANSLPTNLPFICLQWFQENCD